MPVRWRVVGMVFCLLLPPFVSAEAAPRRASKAAAAQTKKFHAKFVTALKKRDKQDLIELFSSQTMSGGCENETDQLGASEAAKLFIDEMKTLETSQRSQLRTVTEFRDGKYFILLRLHRNAQNVYLIEVRKEGRDWQAARFLTCGYDQAAEYTAFKTLFQRLDGTFKSPKSKELPE